MLALTESEASGMLYPTATVALLSGIFCLCLMTTAADAARQIHIAQVFARCLDDQAGKKPETKLMTSMVKSCEGKHRCRAIWRFTEPQNCPTDKKRLVTTIQCGAERKDITSTGSHTIVCTRRRFTIDGKQLTAGRPVSTLGSYSAFETLRDGSRVEIRALRPDDQASLIAAVARTSARSLQRRFFGLKRTFTDQEVAFFMNVDFINHVALLALIHNGDLPVVVGGGRYIVMRPDQAEVALVVLDEYQGRGIGRALMHHLTTIARAAGLHILVAEVLPENAPMLKLFKTSGLRLSMKREGDVTHVTISLS